MGQDLGKEDLQVILIQAMCAAKSARTQLDRLLQLRRLLQLPRRLQRSPGADDAGLVQEVAAGLFHVYFWGLEYASRYVASCFMIAVEKGACLHDLNPAFTVIPQEQLYDVLLAQRLPAPPTTQAQAFARLEAALHALKLAEEHHVPCCIELLVGVRPPNVTGKPSPPFIGMAGYSDDPVVAALKYLAKNGLPNPDLLSTEASASAAAAEPPKTASSVDLDQALSYLHRACSLTSLALKHIDLSVALFSSFFDPEELADTAETVDQFIFIPEE
uniref:Uncharacterized protein n=1 Tax=Avena sativa TaxID=4498 RepID=A0ACD5TS01_AVESA